MPNWCFNNLRVDGDNKQSLDAFRDWLGTDGFSLSKIVKLPTELENTTSLTPVDQTGQMEHYGLMVQKYGAGNWYDWCKFNWGTKWDVDAEVQDGDSLIFITFDSAWSPPLAAIEKLGRMFPDLGFTLTYKEEGMGFAGMLTVNGNSVDDYCVESSVNKSDYRQFCIDEFDTDPFEHETSEEFVS